MKRYTSCAAAALVIAACAQPANLVRDDSQTVLSQLTLQAPNPALPGEYKVLHTYYGSGTDKQRVEYRDSVFIKTPTVDAKDFVTFGPDEKKERKKFFGFDTDKFPLNGRVWYPEGAGPFPLVLIVHGNHSHKDFSDPGYKYLGELMASRGYIFVSVDENFLNASSAGNEARAYFMMKHFEQWKKFNETPGNLFYQKVDWNNLAVAGHSRGGETVGHVALFNSLDNYPDNANIKFNFHYPIKTLIAIAPVDEQYAPSGKLTTVENVNYLVIHGSHDGDVSTFQGLEQYQRVYFTDDQPWAKAAVYVYRANHGQWNTVWRNMDGGKGTKWYSNVKQFISMEDQMMTGKMFISAFLEATLRGKTEYLQIFRDHRSIGQWLPKTIYMTRFEQNDFRPLVTFQEDINVRTADVRGSKIDADSLSTWKEARLPGRSWGQRHNTAVWLGWNNFMPEKDGVKDTVGIRTPGRFTVTFPDTIASSWQLDDKSELKLSVFNTGVLPGPRFVEPDTTKKDTAKKADSAKKAKKPEKKKDDKKAKKDTVPPDFSIEVGTTDGVTSRVTLSAYGPIRPPLKPNLMRFKRQQRPEKPEIMLQDFRIPIADFVKAQPRLDPRKINTIRFIFDRVAQGEVVVDDIGFTTPGRPPKPQVPPVMMGGR
jgi:hypothetical protein